MTGCALLAVEWGSAQRRLFGLDADGAILWRDADDRGVLSLDAAALEDAVDTLVARAGGAPVIMAGMIGSDRGWRLAPYASCPARLDMLTAALVQPRIGVAIVPGVSTGSDDRADVMRGEEVQILGAAALGVHDGLVCVPGKHAKWARVERGAITRFRTMMSGELNAHLRASGVLAAMMQASDPAADAPFRQGVAHALANDDVLAELFHARARVLLGRAPADSVAGYVAGLLIGEEARLNLRGSGESVILVGDPALCARYAAALDVAGRQAIIHDGETAFVAGMHAIWTGAA